MESKITEISYLVDEFCKEFERNREGISFMKKAL